MFTWPSSLFLYDPIPHRLLKLPDQFLTHPFDFVHLAVLVTPWLLHSSWKLFLLFFKEHRFGLNVLYFWTPQWITFAIKVVPLCKMILTPQSIFSLKSAKLKCSDSLQLEGTRTATLDLKPNLSRWRGWNKASLKFSDIWWRGTFSTAHFSGHVRDPWS